MLTYAGVHRLQDVLMRNLHDTERYIDHALSFDYSIVFDDGELVLLFDNMPFWKNHHKGGYTQSANQRWGRRMERYIRLVIKLKAHRARLGHKQHHHATPR